MTTLEPGNCTKPTGQQLPNHLHGNRKYPTSKCLPFPYPTGPYPQQAALMDALLEGIPRSSDREDTMSEESNKQRKTRILALESPTGTGKSLSLACAGLAWLEYEERKYFKSEITISPEPSPSPSSVVSGSTGIDWLDSWQPPSSVEEEDQRQREEKIEKEEDERYLELVQKLKDLRTKLYPLSKSNMSQEDLERKRHRDRRENVLRMALTKSKMEERKRFRDANRNRKRKREKGLISNTAPTLAYDDDDERIGDLSPESRLREKLEKLTPGTAEWLLQPRLRQLERMSKTTSAASKRHAKRSTKPPQIVYAARTHSQLSQFIEETRKTKWGKSLRVVALGSRGQGLCGELTSKVYSSNGLSSSSTSMYSEERLTEACLDRKKSKTCSHFSSDESVATLALHGLVEATDLEDLASLGKATKTCAYYATRKALPHAQLVVVPYTTLCSAKSRASLGLELHSNSLVLVDEAHNLPDAIGNLSSATLRLSHALGAIDQLENYLSIYKDRLSALHLRWLGQLKQLIRGFIASMSGQQKQQRILMSSSQYLVSQRLETINLFPILRYMGESKLSQKLLGFIKKKLDPTDKYNSKRNACTSSHISPMSFVETFLEKLTYASDKDGKVVIRQLTITGEQNDLSTTIQLNQEPQLHFCVLNPAVHACDELWTAPRAVALVGGTLQPLDVMINELVPGKVAKHAARAQQLWRSSRKTEVEMINPYRRNDQRESSICRSHKLYRSDEFWAFTCGHVVDSSRVLLQSLTKVNGISIDVRHKTRSTSSVTTAIGMGLIRLSKSVPNGMVVFLPSYKYESILVEAWKKNGRISIWDQLRGITTVIREPREASQVEITLSKYSKAATRSPNGALLLSVVGGKLSEGINFADDLCRCVVVVGLPFADKSDPLLQEKLKLIGESEICRNRMDQSKAAQNYYRSLCLRAVNQSVGRAIRHAKDWASIVLMDERYLTDESIGAGLPSWLTESTPTWRRESGNLGDVIHRIESFSRVQS